MNWLGHVLRGEPIHLKSDREGGEAVCSYPFNND